LNPFRVGTQPIPQPLSKGKGRIQIQILFPRLKPWATVCRTYGAKNYYVLLLTFDHFVVGGFILFYVPYVSMSHRLYLWLFIFNPFWVGYY